MQNLDIVIQDWDGNWFIASNPELILYKFKNNIYTLLDFNLLSSV